MNKEVEIIETEVVETELAEGKIVDLKITDIVIIDIEEYAKSGKTPPKGKKYRIRIDKDKYTVSVPQMTGLELLELAKKDPEQNNIYQKFNHGEMKKIALDEQVDFTTPGIERFCTLPLDQTEGCSNHA